MRRWGWILALIAMLAVTAARSVAQRVALSRPPLTDRTLYIYRIMPDGTKVLLNPH